MNDGTSWASPFGPTIAHGQVHLYMTRSSGWMTLEMSSLNESAGMWPLCMVWPCGILKGSQCHLGKWDWGRGWEIRKIGSPWGIGSVRPPYKELLSVPAGCLSTGLIMALFAECPGCSVRCSWAGICGPWMASDSILALTVDVESSNFSLQTLYCVTALVSWLVLYTHISLWQLEFKGGDYSYHME
jgi:hypothetical protein